MPDFICRDDLVRKLTEELSRRIEDGKGKFTFGDIIDVIMDAPILDVEPLQEMFNHYKAMLDAGGFIVNQTRCKDCKWFDKKHSECYAPVGLDKPKRTDYCSRAERKDGTAGTQEFKIPRKGKHK